MFAYRTAKKLLMEAVNEDLIQRAADPNTPGEELNKIALENESNSEINKALASNPSSSPELIVRMAGRLLPKNMHHVIDNPALPLFALENPSFLHNLNAPHEEMSSGLHALANHENTPEYLQSQLATHPNEDVASSLAFNQKLSPNAARDLYRRAENTKDDYLHDALSGNPNIPDEIHSAYLDKLDNPKTYIHGQGVLANPKTHAAVVHNVLNKSLSLDYPYNKYLKRDSIFALQNPNLAPEYISRINEHPGASADHIDEYILHHKNTPDSVLNQFANSSSFDNKYDSLIAKHPNASNETLQALSNKTRDPYVVRKIVNHPNFKGNTK